MDRNENVLAPLVGRIIRYGAVLSAVSWAFTLIWGFELRTLLGFAVGYGFMCAAMLYLSHTCERAVELDAAKAKRLMTRCYVLRYFALFAVCAAAMLTGLVNVVGVLVPVLCVLHIGILSQKIFCTQIYIISFEGQGVNSFFEKYG